MYNYVKGVTMKSKKIAVLLSILLLQPVSRGLIPLDDYFESQSCENQDYEIQDYEIPEKKIDKKIKKLEQTKKQLSFVTAVSSFAGVGIAGGIIYLGEKYEEKCKDAYEKYMTGDQAINEIISRFDKFKDLKDHRKIFKGFIEEASKILIECNQNDYGEETDKQRESECKNDAKKKSELEADKTSFRLIAKGKGAICADYTKVLGYIAQYLGIPCYALSLIPNSEAKDKSGHSVLLLADLNDSLDVNNPWKWVILDGRWFSSKELKKFANPDGTLPIDYLDRRDEIWGEYFKGGELGIDPNLMTGWTKKPKSTSYTIDDEDVQTLKRGGYLHVPKFKIVTVYV